ncbi:MAG: multicopper oxidase domain-containing protein [Candidatus Thermoplasmatota archaeon]
MDPHRGLLTLAVALLTAAAFAGCASNSTFDPLYDPLADVKETGNTIHLKMKVVDLFETQLYPNMEANMWAFCVEPFSETDEYTRNAIEYFTPLETDAPLLTEKERQTCSVPGPTIRAQQGDRIIVEFGHSHFHPHTIHWHGQFVDAEDDGVPGHSQEAVPSGGSFTYDFIAKRPGTLWYHCHVDTQFHVMQGLYGMFIVEPADDTHEPEADQEGVLVLSTATRHIVENIPGINPHAHPPGCFTSGTPNCVNPPLDTEPDIFLWNGHSFPFTKDQEQSHWKLAQDERLRLRILNAGNSFEVLHPHGQDMLVTHKDGLPLSAPYWVDTLPIGPAERYDVILVGHNPGSWVFHTHVNHHEANDQQVPGGMHTSFSVGDADHHGDAFPSELPGGFPYQEPVYIPDDVDIVQRFALGTSQSTPVPTTVTAPVSKTLTFNVELPCAVKEMRVSAYLGGLSAGAGLTNLQVVVADPDGGESVPMRLGGSPPNPTMEGTYNITGPAAQKLPQGNYTIRITGTTVEADLMVTADVDYYGSFDEIKYLHKLDKSIALCGTYGNGTDGLETKAPPP